ncbi:MAG TPA: hypothetical protein VM388_15885 [Acidimicrobiales bacterium]|nr:hypothetical protein [Acidimicrobiales bacterium]
MAVAVAQLVQPVAMAGERLLPVLGPLEPLFPTQGLKRGSVVSVSGSTSLALSLLAAASAQGSWCAAVGMPALGLAAAAELGVALERFPLVPTPARATGADGWAWVVAAMADACDVVLARPPRRLAGADARRLTARVRERGSVLVVAGQWPEAAEVQLAVVSAAWEGLGQGHGRLLGRRVEVLAGGRGAAARERRVALWLPHPEGGVRSVEVVGERRTHARRVVS